MTTRKEVFVAGALLLALAATLAMSVPVEAADADAVTTVPGITTRIFGRTPAGAPVLLYTLRNAHGMEVAITPQGATVVSIRVPDQHGVFGDVVLGFDSLDGYLGTYPYFGATVGRYGNRIAKGRFKLGGKDYALATNNGVNHLHGGNVGFDKRLWIAHEISSKAGPGLELQYTSADGEEGYPGTLAATVTYTLTAADELRIDYRATTDKPTVVNLTNHSYFNLAGNLAGQGDVLGHVVQIRASRFTPIDAGFIPTGEIRSVKGTPFDFTAPHAIGERIAEHDAQLTNGKGYDHNWVLDGPSGKLRLAARVSEPTSGRVMEVLTTEPGLQFYSGNFLDGTNVGKGNTIYAFRSGFCVETQHYPDSPNEAKFPSTTLRPGQQYRSATVYRFSTVSAMSGAGVNASAVGGGAITDPVRIDTGLVAGVPAQEAGVTVFKGIPFAAPPVGKLRWRAPQPALAWQGVRKADQFGHQCPQTGGGERASEMSEDCLTLNVWTAAAKSAERRPVYVWIYGGGFSGGTGSSPQFDGATLARKGLVVVTFNYRLGALGFLATPELSAESGHHASGNYGLLDDLAVLHWVHENIAAFGGDPARVTIGGQSAGAGSVGFLSMSPLAKGLFQRSIAESHARYPRDLELRYLSVSWRPLQTAETDGVKFAAQRGAHSLAELRALPWDKLLVDGSAFDADVYTGSSAKPPLFRPTVDGWVIPYSYSETYARGAQNSVSFLTGNNLDETGAVPETAFASLRAASSDNRPGASRPSVTLADYRAAAHVKFGPMADEFLKVYPATTDDEAALANNQAARDNSRISTWLWGTEWTRSVKAPVYTYFWTHRPPGPGHDTRGAYHGSEISYAFGNLWPASLPWTDADRRIADTISSYWANYIATGNPNGPGLPLWPAYEPGSPTVMQLGDGWGLMPVAEPTRIEFWKRFFQTQDAW